MFMYAILLYEQFMTFMQPYITTYIYDLVSISYFLYGGQPVVSWSSLGTLFLVENIWMFW